MQFDREITSYQTPQVPIRADYFMKSCITLSLPTERNINGHQPPTSTQNSNTQKEPLLFLLLFPSARTIDRACMVGSRGSNGTSAPASRQSESYKAPSHDLYQNITTPTPFTCFFHHPYFSTSAAIDRKPRALCTSTTFMI